MNDLKRNVELMNLLFVSMPISMSFFATFSNVFFCCAVFVMILSGSVSSLTLHHEATKNFGNIFLFLCRGAICYAFTQNKIILCAKNINRKWKPKFP